MQRAALPAFCSSEELKQDAPLSPAEALHLLKQIGFLGKHWIEGAEASFVESFMGSVIKPPVQAAR